MRTIVQLSGIFQQEAELPVMFILTRMGPRCRAEFVKPNLIFCVKAFKCLFFFHLGVAFTYFCDIHEEKERSSLKAECVAYPDGSGFQSVKVFQISTFFKKGCMCTKKPDNPRVLKSPKLSTAQCGCLQAEGEASKIQPHVSNDRG